MTKLESILKYVSEHNDFYKKRIKEYGVIDPLDITRWPVLTRKELQENRYNMFSDGYKFKYFNQQLHRQSSSGSSGMPINVYWDYKDWYASNMSLWRKRLQWYGIKPSDKYVMFTMNSFGMKNDSQKVHYINQPANILSVNVSMIQDYDGYERLIDIIDGFGPKWLYIQPSVLDRLLQAYKRTCKRPPRTIEYIESVGEILASDLRNKAGEFFAVPIVNMYGSEEMNGIAYENPEHHMQVLEDNVFVEVGNENGIDCCGDGEAIITNLNNRAMPLIRYNQEDSIALISRKSGCQYGINPSEIALVKGRMLESIRLGDNMELNPLILLEIMAEVNNEFDGIISSYRYEIDANTGCIRCYISLDNSKVNWLLNIRSRIISGFKHRQLYDKFTDFELNTDFKNESIDPKRKIIDIIR